VDRKGREAEEAKKGVVRDHWHVYQEMDVGSVEEIRGFKLEKVRMGVKKKTIRLGLKSSKE
jgi:hypothetical protein